MMLSFLAINADVWVMVLSKKIQLEILREVIPQKSDGEKPLTIDLTDPDRKHNFDQLDKDECFVPFTVEKTTPFPNCLTLPAIGVK